MPETEMHEHKSLHQLKEGYLSGLDALRTAVEERDRAAAEFKTTPAEKAKALIDADRTLTFKIRWLRILLKRAWRMLRPGWFSRDDLRDILKQDSTPEGRLLYNYIIILQEALPDFTPYVYALYKLTRSQSGKSTPEEIADVEAKIQGTLEKLHQILHDRYRNQFVYFVHHEASGAQEEKYVVRNESSFWILVKIASVLEVYLSAVENEEEFLARRNVRASEAIAKLADMHMPVLMFDLDGTIVDTDMNDIGTAKFAETKAILEEQLKRKFSDAETQTFLVALNEKTVGSKARDASKVFAIMLGEQFGLVLDVESFVEYRLEQRKRTYGERVKFIAGERGKSWLSDMPGAMHNKAWLVTSAESGQIEALNRNPNILIKGMPIPAFFSERIISGDKTVKKKPDPEPYLAALRQFKPVPNSKGIVGIAFEDSKSGIQAARAARYGGGRLFVVGLASTSTVEKLQAQGVDVIYPSLADINLEKLCVQAGYEWA